MHCSPEPPISLGKPASLARLDPPLSLVKPAPTPEYSMRHSILAATAALFFVTAAASAQTPPAKATVKKAEAMDHSKMDHSKMDKMDMGKEAHGASAWKELDAYHMLVMATWHPAKESGDMAPTRAKANDLVAAAHVVAKSTAPKGCDSPALKAAAKGLPAETQKVADLVTKNAADAALKAALRTLHDKFEVLEGGCSVGEKHEMKN